ncbi:substrate-binding domain-containing protein [Paenibacillus sp. J2TS4]|uniref:GntR family transcriptional regulator n=1 Tax=Paenibacillus sp. J2TS4 TaxID=2807194 RepID=UPI001B2A309D|nr:GntR family transcriptional regulator [Paenibacillus sp. J2TS4]GIP35386.1 GntR family transcriptional regulator [Paenibacillus sp. J2TS4]
MDIPLYEQLYNYILQEIRTKRLNSGDRVPSEKEMADQFNVSRITSKKALEKLNQEGVIKRIRGKGSFVSDLLPDWVIHNQAAEAIKAPPSTEEDWRMIGFITPNFSDEYGATLLRTIEKKCREQKCHLLITRTTGSREEEQRAIRLLVNLGVDGLIVIPIHGEHYNTELLRLVLDGFPVVLADRYWKGIPVCAVYTDNKRAAQELTAYLINKGHERIAFLSPPEKNTSALEERLQGYTMAITRQGLKFNPDYCLTSLTSTLPSNLYENDSNKDNELLTKFIARNPDVKAFVTAEFSIASYLMQVLHSLGKPLDQYEVVCFDSANNYLGQPLFTHIRQDEKKIGELAVEHLIAQLDGLTVPPHTTVDFQIVERLPPLM